MRACQLCAAIVWSALCCAAAPIANAIVFPMTDPVCELAGEQTDDHLICSVEVARRGGGWLAALCRESVLQRKRTVPDVLGHSGPLAVRIGNQRAVPAT
jgi:hypothetical protein